MNFENEELRKLEEELEGKLKGQTLPKKSEWKPYEKFMKDLKKDKTAEMVPKITIDKYTKQLYKDLEKEQRREQKRLLKEIKKLSKELNQKKLYKRLKASNQDVKNSMKALKQKNKKQVNVFYEDEYTLNLIEKSKYAMKKFNGEVFNYEPDVDIVINSQTIKLIATKIYEKYSNIYRSLQKIYSQGYYVNIKITFYPITDKNNIKSLVFKQNITYEDIEKRMHIDILAKFFGEDYIAVLNTVHFFVFGMGDKGGCATCKKNVDKLRYRDRTVKLISPKSSNDNCLFMCFAHFLDIKGNTLKFKEIRDELGIREGMIDYKNVLKVANYFKCGFVLLNQEQKIISFKDLRNKPTVHIMLMKDHYYIVEYIDYFHCDMCGKKLLKSNETHICNSKALTYYRSRKLKKCEFVDMIDCTDKKGKITEDTMIFFDLETFQENLYHVPYACGFSFGDHKNVNISYGKNCMENFINYIIKQKEKIICAYNGSGFDFYILINFLKDLDIPISNIILNNGRVMSFRFGKEGEENKMFDLYLFINSKLVDACEAYKIENKKMEFDVLKIQSWGDADKYRGEVEPYLKYDVLSLSELFFTFNDSIYEQDQVNITKYITLSNMAYSLWQKSLTDLIEIVDLEKYEFSKRGTYGARCYPSKRKFKSKYYDDVINGKMSYEELKETNEFIYNADVKSLYPASMAGVDGLLEVQYPTGKSRWSDKPDEEYKNNKYGFYEIHYTAPKDIIIPILPRKTSMGGLEWSLFDGSGVYTNVEIKNALSMGYKVNFINRCLVWDTTSDKVFKSYVEKYYKMKEEAEKEDNAVKRSIAKLLLNAMYGKTLQRAIFQSTSIINDYNQLLDFFKDYEISDINILSENKLMLTGIVLNKEQQIKKPCQLGAFVLSYSREIMLKYMKTIDPTLKTHIFTYTDTDSLHIMGEHYKKLKELGVIKDTLGYLDNDIKKDGIIIYENNLAPKSYIYEYINNKNEVAIKDRATMKLKGIPHKCLTYDMYDNYKTIDPVEFSSLKKKHTNLTKADVKNEVPFFSIVNNKQTRTFNKTDWAGMVLNNNCFFPKGYKKT